MAARSCKHQRKERAARRFGPTLRDLEKRDYTDDLVGQTKGASAANENINAQAIPLEPSNLNLTPVQEAVREAGAKKGLTLFPLPGFEKEDAPQHDRPDERSAPAADSRTPDDGRLTGSGNASDLVAGGIGVVSAQRYAGRFLHILKTVPAAQRQAAINALKEEQALETQNTGKEEEAKFAEDKRRALAPVIAGHKERAAALRRKQRDERVMLTLRLRRRPRQLRLPFFDPRYRARSFLGQKRALPRTPRGPGLR